MDWAWISGPPPQNYLYAGRHTYELLKTGFILETETHTESKARPQARIGDCHATCMFKMQKRKMHSLLKTKTALKCVSPAQISTFP